MKNKKPSRFVYWTPRILSILFILFLAMFSLDVFDSVSTWQDILIGLFMHNIPVFILIVFLVIAWKHELVGTIGFTLAGLLYISLMIYNAITYSGRFYMLSYSFIIAGPAFLVAFLFYLNWKNRRLKVVNNNKK